MKKIKLKEEQLRLFEKLIREAEEAPNFDNGDTIDYNNPNEIGIAPQSISDVDGNKKNGSAVKQLGADKILTAQNYWYNGVGGMRRVP
jgi:hypothetical protein